MSTSTKTLLEEEIRSTIEAISHIKIGSDEHTKATEALVKLLDKYNAMDRLDAEIQEKYDS